MSVIGNLFGKLIVAFIGISLIAGGWFLYQSNASFMRTAVKTTGTVQRVVSGVESNGHNGYTTVYSPVVDFKTASGQSIEFQASSSSTIYSPSQSVTVYYQPASPNEAQLASSASSWVSIVLIAVGVLMVIFAPFARYRNTYSQIQPQSGIRL